MNLKNKDIGKFRKPHPAKFPRAPLLCNFDDCNLFLKLCFKRASILRFHESQKISCLGMKSDLLNESGLSSVCEREKSSPVAQLQPELPVSGSELPNPRAQVPKESSNADKSQKFGRPLLIRSFLLLANVLWSQWFLIGVGVVILVAYLAPNVARRGGYLAAQYTFSYVALGVIFLISGLTMPTKILYANLRNWKVHFITQSMCFIITPLFGLAIVECILASHQTSISPIVLAGIMIMLCSPTTVASNITFTRLSGGDDASALIEVTIGNLLGIFVTPGLIQLYLRPSLGLGIGAPTQGVGIIYKNLIEHFGLALYMPLFVGQLLQNVFPKQVAYLSKMLRLPKWASVCLLLLIWMTFSDAFASHAFETFTPSSIILVVLLCVALYPLFTLISFLICRPVLKIPGYSGLSKAKTTAVCFCGPPKSITVGVVLIYVQYSNFSTLDQAILTIPLSLYQGFQVVLAQAFVLVFKRWNDKEEEQPSGEETA